MTVKRKKPRSAQYKVFYPSGNKFTVTGRYILAPLGEMLLPTVMQAHNKAFILDQRAVVFAGERQLYSPRCNMDGMSTSMMKWLKQNPDWPPVQLPDGYESEN